MQYRESGEAAQAGDEGDDLFALLDALPAAPEVAEQGLARVRADLVQAQAPDRRAQLALAVARSLHQGWIKGQPEPGRVARQALVASLRLAWAPEGLPDDLDHPMLPVLLQSEAALDATAGLTRLCQAPAAERLAQQHPALWLLVLRLLKRQRLATLLPPLLSSLADRGVPPGSHLELAQALAMASRQATSLDDLRALAPWLDPLLPGLAAPSLAMSERLALHAALCTLAMRCVDLPALKALAVEAVTQAEAQAGEVQAEWAQASGRLLDVLCQGPPSPVLIDLLDRALRVRPGSVLLRMARARWAAAEGLGVEALAAHVDACDPDDPAFRRALLWLAAACFYRGDADRAREAYERAQQFGPLNAADQLRLAHLQLRPCLPDATLDAAPRVSTESSGAAAFDLGHLQGVLQPWWALALASPRHDGPPVAHWLAQGASMVEGLRAALPGVLAHPDAPALEDALALWRQLWHLARQRFLPLSLSLPAMPLDWGPAYGQWCPVRARVLYRVLNEGLGVWADALLMRPQALGRQGQLRHWLELLRLAVDADLAPACLDDDATTARAVQVAQARLERARAVLGPVLAQVPCEMLAERIAHTSPTQGAVAPVRRLTPWPRALGVGDVQVLAQRAWGPWGEALSAVEAGGPADALSLEEPAVSGLFESVDPQGLIHRHPHQTVARPLQGVRAQGLHVSLSHGLWHPVAGLLRPHPWHLTMGEYPYTHPDVWGAGLHGATLRASDPEPVAEPVLVLANMDAIVHRNYYHWMVLILPRIAWALSSGCLGSRRLLLPDELSAWMRASLQALGVPSDRIRSYRRDQHLLLQDAQVLPPLEFAGPQLIEGLRQQLWRSAGLDPAQPPQPDRCLYISRRGENRRPLRSEDQLAELARAQGYEVVAPETLDLRAQVRLFAQARAVAGPPGAAYTNLMWAQPGTRVLAFFHDLINLPPFVDLSVLRGQAHRWVLGHTLAGFETASPLNAPYDVDLDVARRELAWAAQAPAP